MTDAAKAPALALVPDERLAMWLTHELASSDVVLQLVASVNKAVEALIGEDLESRPLMLIVDFDALDAGELLHLHSIRERGWFGALIAIGKVPSDLQASLNIYRTLTRPLSGDALRKTVAAAGLLRATMKINKLR